MSAQVLSTDVVVTNATPFRAREVPELTHREAEVLATQERERTLALLESLSGDDWLQPTACTLWNVRDMVAHMAGACAGFARWAEFRRQYIQNPYMRETPVKIDAINRRQVEDRAAATPAELVDEFRIVAPEAIRTRQRLPWVLRKLSLPFGEPLGTVPLGYLTDVIYTRDMWMHRLDICLTTGKQFVQTEEHDGRIVALIVRDLAQKLEQMLGGKTVLFELDGPAGGDYLVGTGAAPDAVIRMDMVDFNLLASDRLSPGDLEARGRVAVTGDVDLAEQVLAHTSVVY